MLYTWSEKVPPRATFVMASYSVLDKLSLMRTCRHGCCVSMGYGSMRLPRYWREATAEEIEEGDWTYKPQVPLRLAHDWWDEA